MEFIYDPIESYRYSEELRGRFNSFITTEFDDSLTVEMQMRSVIKWVKQNINSVQDMVDFINAFNKWLSTCGYEQHIVNVMNEWLNNGKLIKELMETLNFEYTIDHMEKRIDELKEIYKNGDFYSKSEIDKLFNLNKAQNYLTEPLYNDEVRPIFYNKIVDFKSRFDAVKDNKFNLSFITDTHYSPNDSYWGKTGDATKSITHLYNLALFSNELDMIQCGGDNADTADPYTKSTSYSFNNQFVTTALTLFDCPTFFGIGNHDDNNIGGLSMKFAPYRDMRKNQLGNIVTNDEFAELYRHKDRLFGEMRRNDSNYLYKDFDDKKIRYIWLDVYDNDMSLNEDNMLVYPRDKYSMISKEQLKWLINNALKLPNKDWHVIIGMHCPLDTTIQVNTNICINHDKALSVINAFKNGGSGTLEFSEEDHCDIVTYNFEPSNLVCVINGHLHRDEFTTKENVNYMSVDCSLGGAHAIKYYDTDKEDSWKVFSVDTTERKVNIISFGRGDDREFTY